MKSSFVLKFMNCLQFIVVFYFLVMNRQQLDIVGVFLYTFAPIIVSFLLNYIDMFLLRKVSFRKQILTYVTSNIVYLISAMILLSSEDTRAKIFELSQKYASEFVTISHNESPVFTILICTVIIITIHYMIIRHRDKEQEFV